MQLFIKLPAHTILCLSLALQCTLFIALRHWDAMCQISPRTMQPSTAGISGNIVLEDIPVQLMAICGTLQDCQQDGKGYCIMASINLMYTVTVDIPI
jgi:hypothetical protein